MRQKVGPRKLAQFNRQFGWLVGQPIERVQVRGGTGHRKDLCLADGSIVSYDPNTGEAWMAETRWRSAEPTA